MTTTTQDLQKQHRNRHKRESVLETIESIIVAFILAFIFRAFLIEAFVIPTGSMAPTLHGQHFQYTCESCKYEFAVSANGGTFPPGICPRCGYVSRGPSSATACSGDRILVLKFIYEFTDPQRWDVIVFKNPNDAQLNYIKRLVALPGETVEIVDGDVTIDGRVVQKTDDAQAALWMIVSDTRYTPTHPNWVPRWQAEEGWETNGGDAARGWTLPAAPDGTAWIRYRHRDPTGAPGPIEDYYPYNVPAENSTQFGRKPVTDLHLETQVTAASAETVIVAEMTAWKDRFRFEVPAAGNDRPARILVNGQEVARAEGGVLPVGKAARLEVANVDHRLMLLVDGERVTRVTAAGVSPRGDPLYDPTPVSRDVRDDMKENNAAARVRIGARGGRATIAYLRLDRDVYYLSRDREDSAVEFGTEGRPFTLGSDEYFVLGDNSPQSFDSRKWTGIDRPVVPRRNVLGKAFFVYWPAAGHRILPLMPDPEAWRFVN